MMFGKEKKMSPIEKKAKLKVLGECRDDMSEQIKGKLAGLKKVTVASDSKQGLKEGLEKAEDFLGEDQMEDSEMGMKEDAQSEGYEDEQEDSMPMDEDEINDKIQELMKLKEKLQK